MKNPLKDEASVFQLVWLSIGYFGLIAIASWISTWLGVAVFVVLMSTFNAGYRRIRDYVS